MYKTIDRFSCIVCNRMHHL